MNNIVYTLNQLKDKIQPILKKKGVKTAYLFGSYAKNTASSQSDIDLLVDSGLHGISFFSLWEDLRESLQKEIDLFDFSQFTDDNEMRNDIIQNGIMI